MPTPQLTLRLDRESTKLLGAVCGATGTQRAQFMRSSIMNAVRAQLLKIAMQNDDLAAAEVVRSMSVALVNSKKN